MAIDREVVEQIAKDPPSSRRFHRDDAKGMRLILIADRYILPGRKCMSPKTVSCFVVIEPVEIVVEHPTGVLLTTRFMNHLTGLDVFAVPEPRDRAGRPMRSPLCRIDVTMGVERYHELVAMTGRPIREIFRSRQMKADTFERVRQNHLECPIVNELSQFCGRLSLCALTLIKLQAIKSSVGISLCRLLEGAHDILA